MYDAQSISLRIKELIKENNITMKKMLSDCNLNINYISEMSKGKQPSIKNLKKISNYFNITIDDLLGISNKIQTKEDNFHQNEITTELLKYFEQLSEEDKLDVFNYTKKKLL